MVARLKSHMALDEVLELNRSTFAKQAVADHYRRSGRARAIQARRWLAPVLHQARAAGAKSLLELGPADGALTGWLCELGFDVTALDFSPTMCRSIRHEAPLAEVVEAEFLAHDLNARYDIILASAFVHLFPAPWDLEVVRKISGLLSPSGSAFLATTLHAAETVGVQIKAGLPIEARRFRNQHTRAGFESLIEDAGMTVRQYYAARDRLSTSKTWGNWIASGAWSE